jgi:hypothetical protein
MTLKGNNTRHVVDRGRSGKAAIPVQADLGKLPCQDAFPREPVER